MREKACLVVVTNPFGDEIARRVRQIAASGRRLKVVLENQPNHNGEEHVMATNKPVGDNARKGAVKKRSQLATKTMGKKTFTKRNKEGGQFMAQKKRPSSKACAKRDNTALRITCALKTPGHGCPWNSLAEVAFRPCAVTDVLFANCR